MDRQADTAGTGYHALGTHHRTGGRVTVGAGVCRSPSLIWATTTTQKAAEIQRPFGQLPGGNRSAGAVHHHGFALDPNQVLVFQRFQDAAHHLPGTTNNTANLLASRSEERR